MSFRLVGHLDLDAFFAAVEERDHPHLAGQPIVVGADPEEGHGRGIVATANYPARAYGIRTAMPISTAWRLSHTAEQQGKPPVQFMRSHFSRYGEAARAVLAHIARHAPVMQRTSTDEAAFDLTDTKSLERAAAVCQKIKDDIKTHEGITASIGIGPNKLVAKIAADFEKPDGLTVVAPAHAAAFLAQLPVRALPGVGPKTEAKLSAQGITKVRQLQELSPAALHTHFGRWGDYLHDTAWGRDDSPLLEHYERKSLGEQSTLRYDTRAPHRIIEELLLLCRSVYASCTQEGVRSFRTVVVTVRFSDFTTYTRAHTLSRATRTQTTLVAAALKLVLPFLDRRENPRALPIRMLGVRIEKLSLT